MLKQLAVGLVILIMDQLSKFYISTNFFEGESVPLLKPVIYLTYVNNPGAAFGLFANKRWLLVAIGIGALLVTWIFRRQIAKESSITQWGIVLAISGALGNLIDRIFHGVVIDFIDLRFWPIFNIADIAIVCGIALLFWEVLRDGRQKTN